MGNNIEIANLEHIVSLLPGVVAWKNKEGQYLGCNNTTAAILNLNSPKEIIGRTLEEIMPKKYAKPLLENDQLVMTTCSEKLVEEVSFDVHGNDATYLSRKLPLCNNDGGVIGMLSLSFDITDQKKIEHELRLAKEKAETALAAYTNPQQHLKSPTNLQHLLENADVKRYYLAGEIQGTYLTKREAQCVINLVQGKSAKEVGKILKLSPRTVEYYLEKIKRKLGCRNQTELIAKAIESRFIHNIDTNDLVAR